MKGQCTVCGALVNEWKPFRRPKSTAQANAGRPRLCPECGSFERHRIIWILWRQRRTLENHPRFLHFAPERCHDQRLRALLGERYVTADLSRPGVDVQTDITHTVFEDNSFDLIYCSNVLEHIPDDRRAMSELYRVLSPGGLAIIQVPIKGDHTYEDDTIITPNEREHHFGQWDHVRYYGRDIQDRLVSAGFQVEELSMPGSLGLSDEEISRFNIRVREWLYLCVK